MDEELSLTGIEAIHLADCRRAGCDHQPFVLAGEEIVTWSWCALCRRHAMLSGAWDDTPREVWNAVEDVLASYDASFKLNIASWSAWAGEMRLTLTNPREAPSRSACFYSVGGISPEDVAIRLLDDVAQWLKESEVTPLPPPTYD